MMNLNDVKKELSSDEKILEQAFHIEKFYKKNKKAIIAVAAIAIIAVVGLNVKRYQEQNALESANNALLALQKNPNDSKALSTLKSNNIKLYRLYQYSASANSGLTKELESLKLNIDDKLLQDLINYHISVSKKDPSDSVYYSNLAQVEKAYKLIKDGKKDEARNILAKIPQNSPVSDIAKLLKHMTIK